MMYVSYEYGSEGMFSDAGMKVLYDAKADKETYPCFEDWKEDVLKSGVFEIVKALEDMSKEELQAHKAELESMDFDNEWQYEFTRQEIKEIERMIKEKK